MPYDVVRALKDGVPEEEIAKHLAATRNYRLGDAVNAGVPYREIIDYLAPQKPIGQKPTIPQEPVVPTKEEVPGIGVIQEEVGKLFGKGPTPKFEPLREPTRVPVLPPEKPVQMPILGGILPPGYGNVNVMRHRPMPSPVTAGVLRETVPEQTSPQIGVDLSEFPKEPLIPSPEPVKPTLGIPVAEPSKEVTPPFGARHPYISAIPPTVLEVAKSTVPFGKYAGEEGRKELKGEFFPTGTTTDPEKLKEIEKELVTGEKKISPYESLAGEIMRAAEWAAFPTVMRTVGVLAKEVIPKGVTEFFTKPISKIITDSAWFRSLTIKERGLATQSLDDMLNRGYSEADVLRHWKNPSWREEALKRRGKGEEYPPFAEAGKPTEPTGPQITPPGITSQVPEPVGSMIPAADRPTLGMGKEPQLALPPGQGFQLRGPRPKTIRPRTPVEMPEPVGTTIPMGISPIAPSPRPAVPVETPQPILPMGVGPIAPPPQPKPIEAVPQPIPQMMGMGQEMPAAAPEGGSPAEIESLARIKALRENTDRSIQEGGYEVAKQQPRSQKGEQNLLRRGYKPMLWDETTGDLSLNPLGVWVKESAQPVEEVISATPEPQIAPRGEEPLRRGLPYEEWSKDPALVEDAKAVAAKNGVKPESLEYVGIQSFQPLSTDTMHLWNVTDPNSPKFESTVAGPKFKQGVPPTEPLPKEEVSKEGLPVSEEGAKQPWEKFITTLLTPKEITDKISPEVGNTLLEVFGNEQQLGGWLNSGGRDIRNLPQEAVQNGRRIGLLVSDDVSRRRYLLARNGERLLESGEDLYSTQAKSEMAKGSELPDIQAERITGITPVPGQTPSFSTMQKGTSIPSVERPIIGISPELPTTGEAPQRIPGRGKETQIKPRSPWEMTREEYKQELMDKGIKVGVPEKNFRDKDWQSLKNWDHKMAVQQAVSEDKPVPPEVLAEYPDLQSSAIQAVPPTAQHLELMPEEYPNIEAVAVKQDGKVYKDHTHGNILIENNLDPEKAIPGFVTKAGKFVEQYPEATAADLAKTVEPAKIEPVTGKTGKGTPTVETPKPVGGEIVIQLETKKFIGDKGNEYTGTDASNSLSLLSDKDFKEITGASKTEFANKGGAIYFVPTNESVANTIHHISGEILLGGALRKNTEELRSKLIHELTHWGQIERGETPKAYYVSPAESIRNFMEYLSDPAEVKARFNAEGRSIKEYNDFMEELNWAKSEDAGKLKMPDIGEVRIENKKTWKMPLSYLEKEIEIAKGERDKDYRSIGRGQLSYNIAELKNIIEPSKVGKEILRTGEIEEKLNRISEREPKSDTDVSNLNLLYDEIKRKWTYRRLGASDRKLGADEIENYEVPVMRMEVMGKLDPKTGKRERINPIIIEGFLREKTGIKGIAVGPNEIDIDLNESNLKRINKLQKILNKSLPNLPSPAGEAGISTVVPSKEVTPSETVPTLTQMREASKGEVGNWQKGESRPFAFDPNSTENEGRFRLLPPERIKKDSYFRRKSSIPGVVYLMGRDKSGKEVTQAIRFDKSVMPEDKAGQWWEENKNRFKFFAPRGKEELIPLEPTLPPGVGAVSQKPKKVTVGDRAKEFYQPGNIIYVDYWQKLDKVLKVKGTPGDGDWQVQVQEVGKDGNSTPGSEPRWHSTLPSKGDRIEKLATPAEPLVSQEVAKELQSVSKKGKEPSGDILFWVRSKGGIDPNTVSADIKGLTQKESGFKGQSAIVRKGGRGLDELAQEWEWETGRPITTDELSDAIKDTVESKKKGIPRKMGLGATDEDIAKFIEKEERKHYRSRLVAADEEFKDYKSFENLTNSFDDEIISLRKEAIRNGLSEADTERSIEQARKRIENEEVPSTPEGIRTVLSEELSSVLTERTPEVTKPELSATAKDQFALPGIKQGIEMKGAKEGITPTLEGTPLMEAAQRAEIEKVQLGLGLTEPEIKQPPAGYTLDNPPKLNERVIWQDREGIVDSVPSYAQGTIRILDPIQGRTTVNISDLKPVLPPLETKTDYDTLFKTFKAQTPNQTTDYFEVEGHKVYRVEEVELPKEMGGTGLGWTDDASGNIYLRKDLSRQGFEKAINHELRHHKEKGFEETVNLGEMIEPSLAKEPPIGTETIAVASGSKALRNMKSKLDEVGVQYDVVERPTQAVEGAKAYEIVSNKENAVIGIKALGGKVPDYLVQPELPLTEEQPSETKAGIPETNPEGAIAEVAPRQGVEKTKEPEMLRTLKEKAKDFNTYDEFRQWFVLEGKKLFKGDTRTSKLTRELETNEATRAQSPVDIFNKHLRKSTEFSNLKELYEDVKAKEEKASISDFGKKIGGARKDLWKERGLSLEDVKDMTLQERETYTKKAHVWPSTPYETFVKDGMSPGMALLVKKIKDSISVEPEIPRIVQADPKHREENFKRYIELVSAIREKLPGVRTIEDIRNLGKELFPAEKVSEYSSHYTDQANKDLLLLGGKSVSSAFQPSKYDLSRAGQKAEKTGFPAKQEAWQKQYAVRFDKAGDKVYRDGKEIVLDKDEWFVTKKDAHYILQGELSSREEAEAWAKDQAKSKGEHLTRPFRENIERTGADYRQGKNKTGDEILSEFGFRGGEFGNWTNQSDRQQALNEVYDALMDLADTLKVPPKALSLNGELGIAFGARGGGSASAHYEPGRVVINLTKTRGAGSLAHEWAHAVDDYFGRQVTGGLPGKYVSHGTSKAGEARKEMLDAWGDVMKSISDRVADKEINIAMEEKGVKQMTSYLNSWLRPVDAYLKENPKADTDDVRTLLSMLHGEKPNQWNGEKIGPQEVATRLRLELIRSGYKMSKEDAGHVGNNAWHLEKAQINLTKAEAGELVRTEKTDFLKNALAKGKGKSDNYWQRKHELFARAFESFIEDELNNTGNKSDYLVHSTYESPTSPWGAIYPQGKDRVAINKAFKKWKESLKTKGEGGKMLYSAIPLAIPFLAGKGEEDKKRVYPLRPETPSYLPPGLGR